MLTSTPAPHRGAAPTRQSTPAHARHSVAYAQNFLRDPRLVERLLDRSSLGPTDTVLEIGPGKGIITAALAGRCRRVVAVEKDPALARLLRARFACCPNVAIHEGDFLQVSLPPAPYKVFANVPFNVTAEIVQRLIEVPSPPEDAYLAVQREAAERFLGQPRESLRSVLLKPWFEPALVHRFKRADFIPAPQVEVVLLRLRKRGPPLLQPSDAQPFRDLVTHLFTAWQPSLHAALRGLLTQRQLALLRRHLGATLEASPSAVPFEQWLALYAEVHPLILTPTRSVIAGSEARLTRQQAGLQKLHRTRRPKKSREQV